MCWKYVTLDSPYRFLYSFFYKLQNFREPVKTNSLSRMGMASQEMALMLRIVLYLGLGTIILDRWDAIEGMLWLLEPEL